MEATYPNHSERNGKQTPQISLVESQSNGGRKRKDGAGRKPESELLHISWDPHAPSCPALHLFSITVSAIDGRVPSCCIGGSEDSRTPGFETQLDAMRQSRLG